MDIKILVAAHKKYWMAEDMVYMPLHVGAEGKEPLGYTPDNTGNNISAKNRNYCELTGLYWAWKNLKSDYIGLCHYRRYFARSESPNASLEEKKRLILKRTDYEKLLQRCDVIVPLRFLVGRHRTTKDHYEGAHSTEDLCTLRQVIQERQPDYVAAFDAAMKRHSFHYLNMFVMKKEHFDSYCKWLFSILFEVEKRVDISDYDSYQARIFGFMAERLLDVWLYNQKLKIKEVPVVYLEPQQHVGLKERIKLRINRIIYPWLGW